MNKHDIDNCKNCWRVIKIEYRAGKYDKLIVIGTVIAAIGITIASIYLMHR